VLWSLGPNSGVTVTVPVKFAAGPGTGGHAPLGETRPLSLFLVTVAASGDRKTTTDAEALEPVRKHEKALKETYEQALVSGRLEQGAWSAQKKKIESQSKLDYAQRKEQLRNLGPEPEKPLYPLLTAPDPT
jgi:hypothetical protein